LHWKQSKPKKIRVYFCLANSQIWIWGGFGHHDHFPAT